MQVDTLLRCARTLHTWAEHECNGVIQRDSDSYIICSQGNCAKTSFVTAAEAKGPLSINCPACGDPAPIKRHVATGKPYWHNAYSGARCYQTPDRETGALKRIAAILAPHAPKQYTAETCPGRPCGAECDHASPGLTFYHQGDPRGCCLYLIRPGDVPAGSTVDSCYSNGIAVCID
jgi:hypothetical protein